MISISKTQNKNLKACDVNSFSSEGVYLPCLLSDPAIKAPTSLKKFIQCFNTIVRYPHYISVAFDASNNKLYIGRESEYSTRIVVLPFDITKMTEAELGYTLYIQGVNWTTTVKNLNNYHGKEYAKMSDDKMTLIIETTDHTELKAVLQVISRLNSRVNMCVHNGLGENAEFKTLLQRFKTASFTDSEDVEMLVKHAESEMMKYYKQVNKQFGLISDIDTYRTNIYSNRHRFLNYTDEKNFELYCMAKIQYIYTGLRYESAAPEAFLSVKYKVVNGKASWKLFDDTEYIGVFNYDRDRESEVKIGDEFIVQLYDYKNSCKAGVKTVGYANYLKFCAERSKKYKEIVATIKKAFNL